jgi:glucose/arabinose dehydrogenase
MATTLRLVIVSLLAAVPLACGSDSGSGGTDGGAGATSTARDVRTTTAPEASPSAMAGRPGAGGAGPGVRELRLRSVGRFEEPVLVTYAPGTPGMVVLEKGGRALLVHDGARRTLLDLRDEVSTGGEQGLLGLAFHPDFERTRRLFVNYTDVEGDTRIVEYRLPADGRASRVRELLHIEQPYENHNGGHLAFGLDGMLWIGTGDGGAAGDPEQRAVDREELLGKMLRIDVDTDPGGDANASDGRYSIPADNPLASTGRGRREIWAIGLRNPWRYAFDAELGALFIGDVGQGEWEEIDAISVRTPPEDLLDFGWDSWEGFEPFEGDAGDGRAHTRPVLAYSHDDGCSVTGGHVYRGDAMPGLVGWYVYADYCSDWIRAFPAHLAAEGRRVPERAVREFEGVQGIASFGEGARGELYVAALDGHVYEVAASEGSPTSES